MHDRFRAQVNPETKKKMVKCFPAISFGKTSGDNKKTGESPGSVFLPAKSPAKNCT
jgi:hypothetical protein